MMCKQLAVRPVAQRSRPALPVRPRKVAVVVAPRALSRRGLAQPILCASGLAHPGEEANGQHQQGPSNSGFDVNMSVPNFTMAGGGGFGSNSSLGAVMEKSRLNFVMPTPVVQGPKLDDGGSGGDIGKRNHNGGGGGGDDGDDDDYFADGDDEGDGEGGPGGDGFFRTVVPESYDRLSIGAVLSEWMRSLSELPLIIKRAVEMGLFSSAQLVRFFSMDVRPNITRSVSRALPPQWARELVGRLMADPAFLQKMVLEQTMAVASSLLYEWQVRGDRFKHELDQVAINTLCFSAATGAAVWLVAPSRSYGNVHKFPWQQMLADVPNCVFDASGPLRDYSLVRRVTAFFIKMAELSAVGAVAGSASSLLCSASTKLRQKMDPSYQPSVSQPDVSRSSAGSAAFFALNMHTRFQLLGGVDRYLFSHSNYLWTYLASTGFARFLANRFSEPTRVWLQGLQPAPALTTTRRVRRVVKKTRASKRLAALKSQEASAAALAAGAPLALEGAAGTSGQQQYDELLLEVPQDGSAASISGRVGDEVVYEELPAGASTSLAQQDDADSYDSSNLVIVTSNTPFDPQGALANGGTAASVPASETVQPQQSRQGRGRRELATAGQ